MIKTHISIFLIIIFVFISGACSVKNENLNISNQDDTVTGIVPIPEVKNYTPDKELISNHVTIEKNQHNVYKGVIGNKEIMIDIYRKKDKLTAYYLYRNMVEEIEMKGEVSGSLILLKSRKNDKDSSQIEAYCLKKSDDIEGTFITDKPYSNQKISLKLVHIAGGDDLDERYMFYINQNKEVENFAETVKQYIMNEEKGKLSQLIHYPIEVSLKEKGTIQNASEFIKYYDRIIEPKFKEMIANSYTKYMFSNWRGIMLGSETRNIWITQTSKRNKVLIYEIIS